MALILPQVIAHRGASRIAPENTIASMEQAKKYGAQWIEFDVRLTSDNVPVIFHDATLRRTTNYTGIRCLSRTKYTAIQTLDAGSWFNAAFSNEKIPTLESYLITAAQLQLGINIELKTTARKSALLAEKVLQLLKQHWPQKLPQPLLSSASVKNLLALNMLSCSHPLALNVVRCKREDIKQAVALNCYSIHVKSIYITPKIIADNAQAGLKTLAYTVNNPSEAQHLINLGVTAIFTDNEALYK